MTTFPIVIAEQGLVLDGHPTKTAARKAASAWLQQQHQLGQETADDIAAEAPVANDAWWSDDMVTDGEGNQVPACFVSPQFSGATAVTVIALPNPYLTV